MRLAWLWIAGTVVAGPSHYREALLRGQAQLERGRWRMAATEFRAALLDRPKSPLARVGLARAASMTGRCDEALELLESVRGKWSWTAQASVTEARCYLRMGRHHEAIEAYELAVSLNRWDAEAWLSLAQTRGVVGDSHGLEVAVEGLRLCEGGPGLELLVRAEVALREGDPSLDGLLAQAHSLFGPVPILGVYEGRAWMDAGDPVEADRVLLAYLQGPASHPQVGFWRAEALRRQGQKLQAEAVFERPVFRWALDDPLALNLRSRLLADQGQLDAAEALVERLPDPLTAESLASRWYVARARGRMHESDRLAALWSSVDSAAGRTLEQLVPIGEQK